MTSNAKKQHIYLNVAMHVNLFFLLGHDVFESENFV